MQKVVTFGEIMLRLSPPGYLRFSQASSFDIVYGGGESNVAVSLANYDIPVEFVTALPPNDLGDCALQELRKRNVGTSHIYRMGDRLGIYFLEKGAVARASKVLYDRAHSAIASIEPGIIDWREIFRDATWFHWTGITPAISEGAAATCLEAIRVANEMGLTVSTDLNFRKKLWQYGKSSEEVMPELVEGCDIIMGNEEDAEKHFGIRAGIDVTSGKKLESSAYITVCQNLMNRFPKCKEVIITLRGSLSASHNTWSAVWWDGQQLYQGCQYDITHIVDRVGGGDSFMGGLIYGILTYQNNRQKALDFAIAASCLKHTIEGDANLVTVKEVEKLMAGDASGRVSR